MSDEPDAAEHAEGHKRARLYRAAEPLFERYGYHKTTVEDICRAAGVSKRTFYELFKDKADFLVRMAIHIGETIVREWAQGLPESLSPKEQLLSLIDLHAKQIVRRPVLRLVHEIEESHRAIGEMSEEIQRSPLLDIFTDIIERGKRCGEFRQVDARSAIWIIDAVLDGVYVVLPEWLNMPGAVDDPVLAEEAKRFILHGLGASE